MNHTERIQQALKDRRALTVAAIASPAALNIDDDDLRQACDIIELRLDSLGSGPEVVDFAKKTSLPLLVTARGPIEGGTNNLSVDERKKYYRKLLPFASLIDIEIRDFPEFSDVIDEARDLDITIVGSFHDFEKTPEFEELLVKLAVSADLHKFALTVQDKQDLTIHLDLLSENTPLSVMGMGPLGAAARPLMAKAGSILNYGYLGDTPTAPNQWPADLLKSTLAL